MFRRQANLGRRRLGVQNTEEAPDSASGPHHICSDLMPAAAQPDRRRCWPPNARAADPPQWCRCRRWRGAATAACCQIEHGVMALWRVALLPGSNGSRARARWLQSDGRFSLASDEALTVVDPATAARRLQQWLQLRGHTNSRLHRLQLVPCSTAGHQRP